MAAPPQLLSESAMLDAVLAVAGDDVVADHDPNQRYERSGLGILDHAVTYTSDEMAIIALSTDDTGVAQGPQ